MLQGGDLDPAFTLQDVPHGGVDVQKSLRGVPGLEVRRVGRGAVRFNNTLLSRSKRRPARETTATLPSLRMMGTTGAG